MPHPPLTCLIHLSNASSTSHTSSTSPCYHRVTTYIQCEVNVALIKMKTQRARISQQVVNLSSELLKMIMRMLFHDSWICVPFTCKAFKLSMDPHMRVCHSSTCISSLERMMWIMAEPVLRPSWLQMGNNETFLAAARYGHLDTLTFLYIECP